MPAPCEASIISVSRPVGNTPSSFFSPAASFWKAGPERLALVNALRRQPDCPFGPDFTPQNERKVQIFVFCILLIPNKNKFYYDFVCHHHHSAQLDGFFQSSDLAGSTRSPTPKKQGVEPALPEKATRTDGMKSIRTRTPAFRRNFA